MSLSLSLSHRNRLQPTGKSHAVTARLPTDRLAHSGITAQLNSGGAAIRRTNERASADGQRENRRFPRGNDGGGGGGGGCKRVSKRRRRRRRRAVAGCVNTIRMLSNGRQGEGGEEGVVVLIGIWNKSGHS